MRRGTALSYRITTRRAVVKFHFNASSSSSSSTSSSSSPREKFLAEEPGNSKKEKIEKGRRTRESRRKIQENERHCRAQIHNSWSLFIRIFLLTFFLDIFFFARSSFIFGATRGYTFVIRRNFIPRSLFMWRLFRNFTSRLTKASTLPLLGSSSFYLSFFLFRAHVPKECKKLTTRRYFLVSL